MSRFHPLFRRSLSLVALLAIATGAALPGGIFAQTEQPPQQPAALPQVGTTVYLPFVRGGGGNTNPGQPTVTSFVASSTTIAPGGEVTLSWSVSGATSVRIEPGIGPVNGTSMTVKPAATTTYTLIASNGAQEARATVTVTVDPAGGRIGAFMEPEKKTGSPSIVVDAQGGTHLAYGYHVPIVENPDLVYAYCPPPATSCGDLNRWQRISLGGPVDHVQLALTADSKPRILARGDSQKSGYKNFYYGECDANCTAENSWNFITVTDSYTSGIGDITGYYLPHRYFALDKAGRPRFVFYNYDYPGEPDRIGGYYAQCDANCTSEGTWIVEPFTHSIPISENIKKYESITEPSLTFTSNNQPRVVALLYPLQETGEADGIYYFGCDEGCESDANWQRVKIADRGNGPYPSWNLALDSNDNPAVAFYKEDTLEDNTGKKLHYLSCQGDCLNGGWNTLLFDLPRERGDGAAIVFDKQNRPRLAYLDGSDNLHYSWCDANCTDGASWQHQVIETGDQLEAEYPVPRPLTCDSGLWDTFSPSLSLDAAGNPRVAYNGSYKAGCLFQDPTDPTKPPERRFIEIWHSVRVAIFPQP